MKFHHAASAMTAALLSATHSHAATPQDLLVAIQRIPAPGASITYEGVVARLSEPVRLYDLDGNGLDASDIAAIGQVKAARTRASAVARFLPFDLNNDRQVTRAEIDQVYRLMAQYPLDSKQMRGQFASADVDGNNVLDWEEMTAVPNSDGGNGVDRNLQSIVAFDPTPETGFTLADAKSLADQLFAKYDTDKNGIIDGAELAAAQTR